MVRTIRRAVSARRAAIVPVSRIANQEDAAGSGHFKAPRSVARKAAPAFPDDPAELCVVLSQGIGLATITGGLDKDLA
jgi:hypothetical protein